VNSVHDIGGLDGFGAINREPDEPVFHEPWESRVFGISMLGAGMPPITLDARRHQLERLSPAQYLSSSYYERWLARIDNALVETGTLSRDEIDRRMQEIAAHPNLPLPRREDPARAEGIEKALRTGRPASRKIRQRPRFSIGDRVLTRNLSPHGHTRLPRYARGRRGIIVAHHGAHVFPNTNAHGLGENPQHLYTVRIAVREIWGNSAEPNESVLIDLWESYLEKDKAAVKSKAPDTASAARKIMSRAAPPASITLAGRSSKSSTRAGRGSAVAGRGSGKPGRKRR
jgi:nitrile hydratase